MSEVIRAVDLFCGAGGLSWGLVEALKSVAIEAECPTEDVLQETIDLVGVNHWEVAIETHERNHPWARHFHDSVQNVSPREVFDGQNPEVKILSGGIECVHWSTARGGKPVDEQKRMPAWDVLTWIQKLRPENVLLENVKEFESWGPVEDDGTPTRTGETFEQWIDGIHSLGYSVDWEVLNAADYGDATSRKRLFIVARREHKPEFPDPTHSEDGEGDTEEWRPAAEIIDWSDPGESIWSRSRPLVQNTMQRIAEGIRRHGGDALEPYAAAVGELEKEDVEAMQEMVVPAKHAGLVAEIVSEPFLVKYYGTSTTRPTDEPLDTVTSGGQKFALCIPYILGQQSGYVPRDAREEPLPVIAARGSHSKIEACPFVLPRNGHYRGLHSNPAYDPTEQPLHTVTAKNHDGHLVSPYLIQYNGQSSSRPIDDPLPTATAKDRFALCLPECYPWGLDVRFRMLQPRELAAAQGFPEDYDFAGNKTETVEQIGNAVPVTLAQRLVESLLRSSTPSLTDYLGDGAVGDAGPATGGVASDD